MLVSTSIPLSVQSVPARAQVAAIYATARNPFTGLLQRVQILSIRSVRDVTPARFLVADVRASCATCGFSVRLETLSALSAICNFYLQD